MKTYDYYILAFLAWASTVSLAVAIGWLFA